MYRLGTSVGNIEEGNMARRGKVSSRPGINAHQLHWCVNCGGMIDVPDQSLDIRGPFAGNTAVGKRRVQQLGHVCNFCNGEERNK